MRRILPALPAVVGELDDIVKDAQVQGAQRRAAGNDSAERPVHREGDGGTTERPAYGGAHRQPLRVQAGRRQPVLPAAGGQGRETAAGFHLTVADFRDNQNLTLDDTDLLTLSACETGMSGNASNGREVDGLGTTAQLKGAKAVISSLWSVNDASTGELMADFYKRWADGAGKVAKVEALRQAQLDLLFGKVTPQLEWTEEGFL